MSGVVLTGWLSQLPDMSTLSNNGTSSWPTEQIWLVCDHCRSSKAWAQLWSGKNNINSQHDKCTPPHGCSRFDKCIFERVSLPFLAHLILLSFQKRRRCLKPLPSFSSIVDLPGFFWNSWDFMNVEVKHSHTIPLTEKCCLCRIPTICASVIQKKHLSCKERAALSCFELQFASPYEWIWHIQAHHPYARPQAESIFLCWSNIIRTPKPAFLRPLQRFATCLLTENRTRLNKCTLGWGRDHAVVQRCSWKQV